MALSFKFTYNTKLTGLNKSFLCQVVRKTDDKEKESTIKADGVKEESLAVAGGRCWKRVWMTVLKKTGDYFYLLLKKQVDY